MQVVYATGSPRFFEFHLTERRESVPQNATVLAICDGKRTIENQDEDLFLAMTDEEFYTIRQMVREAEQIETAHERTTPSPNRTTSARRLFRRLRNLLRRERANTNDALSRREQRPSRPNNFEERKTMSDTTKSRTRIYKQLSSQIGLLLIFAFCLFAFATAAQAATFTVTTTADNGNNNSPTPGSLRKAILDANNNPGPDTIAFNIPGSGVRTIKPPSPLPDITGPVLIDGYTQAPCSSNPSPCSRPNSLATDDNALLLIVLDGTNAGSFAIGLSIAGGSSTVRGLVINHFANAGIYLAVKGNNLIEGNFIGVDPTGTTKASNVFGITIDGTSNNTIGGTSVAARNMVSGNTGEGIQIINADATNNVIAGNFVGTDSSGTAKLGNNDGIAIAGGNTGPANNLIGGTAPGAGNLISGNDNNGIYLLGKVSGVAVQGNLIGTDATGKSAVSNPIGINLDSQFSNVAVIGGSTSGARNIISGNSIGILIQNSPGNFIQGNYIGTDLSGNAPLSNNVGIDNNAPSTIIGGTIASASNIISANITAGIQLDSHSDSSVVQGNFIGYGANGVTPLGNVGDGIMIDTITGNNLIGGTDSGAGNFIAFNGGAGVMVGGGDGNLISSNSITSNKGLGIDLNPTGTSPLGDGVTPNDHQDIDFGPNKLQNFPLITSATTGAGTITIQGTIDSTPFTQLHIEFFASVQPDPSGYGEGQTFIGSTDVTTSGVTSFSVTFSGVPTGQYISATATDSGNTSEFSPAVKLSAPQPTLSISDLSISEGNSGTKNADLDVTLSSASASTITVNYATADGTATAPSDYIAKSGTLTFAPGQIKQTISINLNGDTQIEGDEIFTVQLSSPANATISKANGTVTILNDDSAAQQPTVQFDVATYTVNEGDHYKQITVTRSGDTSQPATVDYATSDGTAHQQSDYTVALGTLSFAAGETSKTLTLLVTDDSYVEGDETLTLTLSNPVGMTLGAQAVAQITIMDNDTNPAAPNAIDDVQTFVRQHYHDFLNREPDPQGFAGWQTILNNCPASGKDSNGNFCDRIEVSSDFYRSAEFHDRGYFIYRFYSASLGRIPKYLEFMKDMQRVSGFLTAQQQEQAKLDFIAEFMSRSEFQQKYASIMDAGQFVDALSATAGVSLANRNQIVQQLQSNQITRAQALRAVIEAGEVDQKFFNEAFVIMQYFGYLRRDADILYLNWLATLNQTHDYRVMVNGFLNSLEYRQRFGQ